jgi:hypothetical protein
MAEAEFADLEDSIETDPPELGPSFVAAITASLGKQLAAKYDKPWTDQRETQLQESIAALVAAARERGLLQLKVVVTKASGRKVVRNLDVDKISRTRSLQ